MELGSGGGALLHSATVGTVVGEMSVGEGPDAVWIPVALRDALVGPGPAGSCEVPSDCTSPLGHKRCSVGRTVTAGSGTGRR
ncbi:hypothetical protein ACFV0H_25585 [Streptomyces erythrochromogenes]|uniref:hypothetical protein n=1 Tax=Streptomyces erythrochromogenes TaxID=285574 RepID=UPI0036AB2C98